MRNKRGKIKKIKHIKNRKRIKEIMNQYEIEIWKAEVYAVLSKYCESDLHKLGRIMSKIKKDGLTNNPAAFLAGDPSLVCENLLAEDEDSN